MTFPLSGGGFGDFTRALLPYDLNHIVSNGQSLSVGGSDFTNTAPSQPFFNSMIFDSSSTYDITAPNASTLSLIPLIQPMRTLLGSAPYPQNIAGQPCDISVANGLSRVARQAMIFLSVVGQSGQPYSYWGPSGSGSSYAASLYEMRVAKRLATTLGAKNPGLLMVDILAGEADEFNSSYAANLQTYYTQVNADAVTIYGSGQKTVPIVQSQQNSFPAGFSNTENISALQQLKASLVNPNILLPCPKYWGPYADGIHFTDYRRLGAYHLRAYLSWLKTGAWNGLWPTTVSRLENVVTIGFNVPVAPLVFDDTALGDNGNSLLPHQTGGFAGPWSGGHGFEAYDTLPNITSLTNTTPIVATFASAHGLLSGDYCAPLQIPSNTNANGCFAVTFVDSTHVSLNGSSGNGTFSGSAPAISPIPVTAAIVGSSVQITLGRLPRTSMRVGYAHTPDEGLNIQAAPPTGRCGTLRDSDPTVFADPNTPGLFFKLQNWCVEFSEALS